MKSASTDCNLLVSDLIGRTAAQIEAAMPNSCSKECFEESWARPNGRRWLTGPAPAAAGLVSWLENSRRAVSWVAVL
jgi:hypothetical protein